MRLKMDTRYIKSSNPRDGKFEMPENDLCHSNSVEKGGEKTFHWTEFHDQKKITK